MVESNVCGANLRAADVAIWTVGVVLLGASDAVTTVDSGKLPDCLLGRLVSLDRTFIAVPALVRCACLNPLSLKLSKPQTLQTLNPNKIQVLLDRV